MRAEMRLHSDTRSGIHGIVGRVGVTRRGWDLDEPHAYHRKALAQAKVLTDVELTDILPAWREEGSSPNPESNG